MQGTCFWGQFWFNVADEGVISPPSGHTQRHEQHDWVEQNGSRTRKYISSWSQMTCHCNGNPHPPPPPQTHTHTHTHKNNKNKQKEKTPLCLSLSNIFFFFLFFFFSLFTIPLSYVTALSLRCTKSFHLKSWRSWVRYWEDLTVSSRLFYKKAPEKETERVRGGGGGGGQWDGKWGWKEEHFESYNFYFSLLGGGGGGD